MRYRDLAGNIVSSMWRHKNNPTPLWCNLRNKMLKISTRLCFYLRSVMTCTACNCLHREDGEVLNRASVCRFLTCILISHLTRSTGGKEKLWTGVREPEEDGLASLPPLNQVGALFWNRVLQAGDSGLANSLHCGIWLRGPEVPRRSPCALNKRKTRFL